MHLPWITIGVALLSLALLFGFAALLVRLTPQQEQTALGQAVVWLNDRVFRLCVVLAGFIYVTQRLESGGSLRKIMGDSLPLVVGGLIGLAVGALLRLGFSRLKVRRVGPGGQQ